jgi:hypothetical protein
MYFPRLRLLSVFAIIASVWPGPATLRCFAIATPIADRPARLARELEQVFEISGEASENALRRLAKLFGSKVPLDKGEFDALVDDFTSSPAVRLLSDQLQERATIGEDQPHQVPTDSLYGNAGSRHDLMMLLWSRSKAIATHEPERAKRYARAAALLAAHDEFGNGVIALLGMLAEADRFSQVCGVAKERREQLTIMAKRLAGQNQALFGRRQTKVFKAIDALSATPGPLDAEALGNCLTDLQEWRNESGAADARPSAAWQVANVTWQLLNLARSRHDEHSVATISGMIREWMKDSADIQQKRWLRESLEVIAAPPRKLYNVAEPPR